MDPKEWRDKDDSFTEISVSIPFSELIIELRIELELCCYLSCSP